jgi:protein-tyrosine phosphatase
MDLENLEKRHEDDQKTIAYLKKHIADLQEEISLLKLNIDIGRDPGHDHGDHYHMLSPHIAVGDIDASYTNFDIIFDLSFCNETLNFKRHDIKENNGVIRIAIDDHPAEETFMLEVLERYVPIILQQAAQGKKILIHCFAGISRSSSLAIACIAQKEGLSFESALEIAQSIRRQIRPNPGFCKAIKTYLDQISLLTMVT